MDYEKKYKEALERARAINNGKDVDVKAGTTTCEYIFPELVESEEEKVRKEIIDFLKLPHPQFVGKRDHEKWIAWLEKQESVDEIVSRCKNSWYNEGKIAGMAEGLTDDEKYQQGWHDALENQGEKKSQRTISAEAKEAMYDKPAWSEEDVRVIDDIFYSINEESVIEELNDRGIMYALKDIRGIVRYLRNWLQDLKRRVQPQPKQEWSKEEIEPIISDYLCGREHYGGMIGRLCHLKPKQKQTEWGENDKAFLDDILCKLEHDLVLNKDEKDWLKSLRPQNRWKPSDEQIAQLQIAVDTYGNEGIYDPILTELLFQLKKLKEGKV